MVNLFKRLICPLGNKSYFLFGPRGSGKTTYLNQNYPQNNTLFFNLLDPELVDELSLQPGRFRDRILSPENEGKTILVDEIQKVPKLLDIVHHLIESDNRKFVLTGSSARRLKQKGVNLLAGRALVYHLYPFTALELGSIFDLDRALCRGLLPDSYLSQSDEEYREYLRAYCLTYLEKEVQQEQWVRNLDPFRRFLQVAAQCNGMIMNCSRISREVGVDYKTIQNYYEILEDTLMGFYLQAFHRSIRKQQQKAPKFYFIDTGILRALARELSLPLKQGTFAFGRAFEHFIILEVYKRIELKRLEWQLSYLKTKDGAEIDLIIDRPGKPVIALEIKSKSKVSLEDARHARILGRDVGENPECYLFSLDPLEQSLEGVRAMHWEKGLEAIGLGA